MNNLDKQYTDLLKTILEHGIDKKDRTGTGTKSIFGYTIRHNMRDGFPLLTTKKMPFKTIVTELLWFLRGDTNIKFLVDNNCHIWDGDAYKNFIKTYEGRDGEIILPPDDYINDNGELLSKEEFINKIKTDDEFAKKWGELGPIYGKQWRSWGERKHDSISNEYFIGVDQIQNLINDLKTNPDSRRLMVNAWNVGELDQMVLPPCHYGFQVYTRELSLEEKMKYAPVKSMMHPDGTGLLFYDYDWEKAPTRAISLMWNQRSVDTFLGLPFNIASYGLLLEIIAKEVNMVPDQLIGNLGDVHLYSNHIEQAKEQIGREMTFEEKLQWVMRNTDVELENLAITEAAAVLKKRTREPFPLPTLKVRENLPEHGNEDIDSIPWYSNTDFTVENYQSHSEIKAPLSN